LTAAADSHSEPGSGRKQASRLLIDEPPLQVLPALAVAVGLNGAIVLQQLHYWIQRSTNVRDGHRWVYNTQDEWQEQFPFWSKDTIERAFRRLRKDGLVVVAKLAPDKRDKTNWYRIDYEKLGQLKPAVSRDHGRNLHLSKAADRAATSPQTAPFYYTETTSETSLINNPPTPRRRGAGSVKVDRQTVTAEEHDKAQAIHAALNEITGAARVLDRPLLRGIVRRLREHPTLTVGDHENVIRKAVNDRSAALPPIRAHLYGKDPAHFAAYLDDDGKPRRVFSTAAMYIRPRGGSRNPTHDPSEAIDAFIERHE
jgi:hypothetical protein